MNATTTKEALDLRYDIDGRLGRAFLKVEIAMDVIHGVANKAERFEEGEEIEAREIEQLRAACRIIMSAHHRGTSDVWKMLMEAAGEKVPSGPRVA